jgi:hypothetical protein
MPVEEPIEIALPEELHVPPGVPSERFVKFPVQIFTDPFIGFGTAFTVMLLVAIQPALME